MDTMPIDNLCSTPKPKPLLPDTTDRTDGRTPASKRLHKSSKELLDSLELSDTERSIIMLIEDKLKPLERLSNLDIVDTLHAEILVHTYKTENDELRGTVQNLHKDFANLTSKNKELRETLLDLQTRTTLYSLE